MKHVGPGLNSTIKRARRRKFLDQMNHVVRWVAQGESMALFAPEGNGGRSPFSVETMLRVQFMQQWFTLSNRRQKMPCTTRRHCANLSDSTTQLLACRTKGRPWGFATCWKSTSWRATITFYQHAPKLPTRC